jgi:hypothetical protein
MFELLNTLPAATTVTVAHQAIRILRHFAALPEKRREAAARRMQDVLKEQDTDLALQVVKEIERAEGTPISALQENRIARYTTELSDIALRRTVEERGLDVENGRIVLDRMRSLSAF